VHFQVGEVADDFFHWREGDETEVCGARRGLGCSRLEFVSALVEIDFLVAEFEGGAALKGDDVHAEDFGVEVGCGVDVGDGQDDVVQLLQGEGHAALWTFRRIVKNTNLSTSSSGMSGKNTGTVKFRLDVKKLPALTKKQLDALRKLKDDGIDYSDIPFQTNVEWTRPGALAPLRK
jgi:hypothetical protein